MRRIFPLVLLIAGCCCLQPVYGSDLPFDYSLSKSDSKYDELAGQSDAKAFLRLGKLMLLIPGGPPVDWEYEIRHREYGNFGVDWNVTGDVSSPGFEEYRGGFNGLMKQAIEKELGHDFIAKTEARISVKIEEKRKRMRRK
jgi:hypothetical protein